MIKVTYPRDSDAEVQVHVVGRIDGERSFCIAKVEELKGTFVALRLTDVIYALDDGMTVYLDWDEREGKSSPILPLSGRGRLDLSPLSGISNPRNEGWTGHVLLSAKHHTPGPKSFFLALEFAKVNV